MASTRIPRPQHTPVQAVAAALVRLTRGPLADDPPLTRARIAALLAERGSPDPEADVDRALARARADLHALASTFDASAALARLELPPPASTHYSYSALDVGFDLRAQGIAIDLPADATSVRYDVAPGESRTVEGDRFTLAEALLEEGYQVKGFVVIEEMPDCWRETHRAAGNFGTWPCNGSVRRAVAAAEADQIIAADPDGYAHIVAPQPQPQASAVEAGPPSAGGTLAVTIHEAGNGLPAVGDFVPGEGRLYRIVSIDSRIQTGPPGTAHWVHATVDPADWGDCPEGGEYPAQVRLVGGEG